MPLVLSGFAVLVSLATAGFVVFGTDRGDGLMRGTAETVASPQPPFDGDWIRRIQFPTQARADSPHHNHMVSLAYNWDWSPGAGWSRDVDRPSVALTMESWYEGLAELNFDMRPAHDSTKWLGGRVMGFAARHDGSYATLALGGSMYSPGGAGIKLTGGLTGEPLLALNEGSAPRDAVMRVRHADGRSAVVLRGGMEPSLAFGFAGEPADGVQDGALRFYGPATQGPLINAVGIGEVTLLASRPSLADAAPRFRLGADGRLEWDDGSGRAASLAGGSGRLDVRGELTTTALRVGDEGAVLRGLRLLAIRPSPGPVAAKALEEQIFAAPGLPADAMVLMTGPVQPDGVALIGARVTRPGEVAVRFANLADVPARPAAGVYQLVVIEADP
jgi:hypothetical protein